MVYLTMSTGVGCGVILGGKLVHGRRPAAEAGHVVLDRRAGNGRRTFEGSASGTALGKLAAKAGLDARGRDLVELVRAGEATAGLGLSGDLLYEPLRVPLADHGPRGLPEPIRVVGAELGDDAGLVGAAGWATTFGT